MVGEKGVGKRERERDRRRDRDSVRERPRCLCVKCLLGTVFGVSNFLVLARWSVNSKSNF